MVRITLAAALAFAVTAMALTPNVAGANDVGNGQAQQFTTGGCVADADCRSACCAEISGSGLGICSAVGAQRQNGKLGCGFDDPNAAATIAAAKAQVAKQGF
ncbi:biotrophy-associated secreted protein 2 [Ophiostoma piceae UAMH 11346]|uniref:Biotrophy-associated secreted protein 2 n=1 Tax=Ophiostoma piceae (strain UAMH 11346) TaxID=1262450 RepID=S3CUY3_OPHP1|nr:biotrophy-associated secreted protein 2 [Ophiostoma piceae UAMH 11346]